MKIKSSKLDITKELEEETKISLLTPRARRGRNLSIWSYSQSVFVWFPNLTCVFPWSCSPHSSDDLLRELPHSITSSGHTLKQSAITVRSFESEALLCALESLVQNLSFPRCCLCSRTDANEGASGLWEFQKTKTTHTLHELKRLFGKCCEGMNPRTHTHTAG